MTTLEPTPVVDAEPSPADQLCERLFGSAVGFTEITSVYLGDRLGLYRALRALRSATSDELAREAGIAERYAREWLEHQASAGILVVHADSDDALSRRYALPEGCAESLTEPDDLANIQPLARALVAIVEQMPRIVEAFRTGGGVPYSAYGAELVEAQAAMNRPIFTHLLPQWLREIEGVHKRLEADPPARVADIACGAAWSSIAMARAYPAIRVDAFDNDEASVALARANVEAAGLSDRIRVESLDAERIEAGPRYDLVTIYEAVHDLAHPVDVLRTARSLVKRGGTVIVMDENVGERFEAPAANLDPFFYGVSMLLCLPAALAEEGAAGTGAVMRPATLEEYAREAGFSSVETLALEHPFFRFYRLHQ